MTTKPDLDAVLSYLQSLPVGDGTRRQNRRDRKAEIARRVGAGVAMLPVAVAADLTGLSGRQIERVRSGHADLGGAELLLLAADRPEIRALLERIMDELAARRAEGKPVVLTPSEAALVKRVADLLARRTAD